MNEKKRLDLLLVELGLAKSRERAQALILSGDVLVNEVPVTQSGHSIPRDSKIRVRNQDHPYVSRGALKLIGALDAFQVDPSNKVALDVGASTGGFTEVLLERGAQRVVALDVGKNQLDWKIRSHPKVKVLEGVNARHLKFEDLGEKYEIIVCDVSFISLTKIFQAVKLFGTPNTDFITLIKPQFELDPSKIGKGGIVTDSSYREEAIQKVTDFFISIGFERKGIIPSPIKGTEGNEEWLAHWKLIENEN